MSNEQNQVTNEKALLIAGTLGSIFLGFLMPLLIWLVKKDDLSFYGKEMMRGMLNFELTIFIASVVLALIPFIGKLLLAFIPLINAVIPILAFIAVMSHKEYKFPFSYEFIK